MLSEMFQSPFTVLALIIGLLYAIKRYIYRNLDFFERRGIKGPKPYPFTGSFGELVRRPVHEVLNEWIDKYGPIFGFLFLDVPHIIVTDPEIIKTIGIKDFHLFRNRIKLPNPDRLFQQMMFFSRDDQWKRLRSITSPTFTSGKMKRMYLLVEACVQKLVNYAEPYAKNAQEVDLKAMHGALTMDVIAQVAFAVTNLDTYSDKDNPFIKNAIMLFTAPTWQKIMFMLPDVLVKPYYYIMSSIYPQPPDFFAKVTRAIIRERRASNKKHNDFLQLLMDAEGDDSTQWVEGDNEEEIAANKKALKLGNNDAKRLTEEEILAQALLFFAAGYETTASTLTYCCYELAINQDIQEKLYQEISEKEGDVDYNALSNFTYLDAVINETLRRYPPAVAVEREAIEDYKLQGTDIVVSKGTYVNFPIYAVHHNSEYWPDPYKFNPDRFLPENKDKIVPYSFLAFGIGPRNCIGMRFALMEARLTLIHLLKRYKFSKSQGTEVPLSYLATGGPPFLLAKSVKVKMTKR